MPRQDEVEKMLPRKTRDALEIVRRVFGPAMAKTRVRGAGVTVAPPVSRVVSEYDPHERI